MPGDFAGVGFSHRRPNGSGGGLQSRSMLTPKVRLKGVRFPPPAPNISFDTAPNCELRSEKGKYGSRQAKALKDIEEHYALVVS